MTMTTSSDPTTHVSAPVATTGRHVITRRTAVRRFALHYLGMVVAMTLGMVVLGPLESLLARGLGRPEVLNGTMISMLVMALNMTVAMVAWMRFRRHEWRPIVEMCAGMDVPFLLVLVPFWLGLIGEMALMVVGHTVMFLGMFAVMLARRQEYVRHRH